MIHTPGPWFVSGVRYKMNGGEWLSVNRYDEANKRDQNLACVGYDPRTGEGAADARLIAAAPEMIEILSRILNSYPGYIPDFCEAIATLIRKVEGRQS